MAKKNLWTTFLPLWVLANTVGWFGFTAYIILPINKVFMPISISLIFGLLQWAILDKLLSVDWRWALAGIPVYGSLNYAFIQTSDVILLALLEVIFLGFVGWLQYAVLKEYLEGARAWFFISPFAGIFGLLFSFAVSKSFTQALAIHGLIYGIITGILLIIVIDQPNKSSEHKINEMQKGQ